jgi:hypothetical protein
MGGSRACQDIGIEGMDTGMRGSGSQGADGETVMGGLGAGIVRIVGLSQQVVGKHRTGPLQCTTDLVFRTFAVDNPNRSIKVTHNVIRHHHNRHKPLPSMSWHSSKSLSFQPHLLSNLLLTFQRRWLRIRIDDCTILSLRYPPHPHYITKRHHEISLLHLPLCCVLPQRISYSW